MQIKDKVLLDKLTPQIVLGAIIVRQAYADHGHSCVITSGSDGEHKVGSLHYEGKALDFRTRTVPAGALDSLVAAIRLRLGDNYDVVLEKDHIHVEYDPT